MHRDITTNHKLYLIDKQYKDSTNLINYIDEAQNFYNGNQYPNANFNNMIRVTMNICSFSANIKASKICGTPIFLQFTADNEDTDCTALRQFDEYNCNKLHLKTSNFQSALNGFVNGTEVTFIRWDEDDTTYKGIYKGGLVEEHIDLRNMAVANPYIQDIQNQAWVMFWEDYPVSGIKDMIEGKDKKEIAEKKELVELEVNSTEEDDYKRKEFINHALLRVYTRFFRVDGEVYFMCSTKTVDLFAYPHPLSKKVAKSVIKKVVDEYIEAQKGDKEPENGDKVLDYSIDYEDLIASATSSSAFSDKEYKEVKEKFSLYPFAAFRPFVQNRSFYGRSDIKQMIPIQKGINFSLSMTLKCMENNAYNKIIVKPDALQGQVITNEPSQVLVDHSGFSNQWGIKFAESQPMPNGLLDSADRVLSMTRVVYGFNDVMDGSISNQDISGYAIQQMIKQANTSTEQQQQLFWLYNEEKAAIRLMYYKHYVDKATYTYELSDAEYDSVEQARKVLQQGVNNGMQMATLPDVDPQEIKERLSKKSHKTKIGHLRNDEIYGVNFDICIEAMQGLADSKLVEQQMWDNLLLNGGIQNISPDILEMYLSASPNVSPATKAALKTVVENIKQGEISKLKAQYQELLGKTQQIMAYAKQLEGVSGTQSEYLKNLQTEFTNKINAQNKIIGALNKDLQSYDTGVSEGEAKSNNSRGIKGSHLGIEGA